MLIGDWIDTVLNVMTFLFLGAMVWVLMRPGPKPDTAQDDETPAD